MDKIPLDELRVLWEQQGYWGTWREMLRKGYSAEDVYFEFGLVPEQNRRRGDYKIVLDHEVQVQLCPADVSVKGQYVIKEARSPEGHHEGDTGPRYRAVMVSSAEYAEMLDNASYIYEQYKDEDVVCFWGIPNKWFSDLLLIRVITDHIILTDDYKKRTRTRADWFWP